MSSQPVASCIGETVLYQIYCDGWPLVQINTYLITTSFFALTALFLGLYNFAQGRQNWRLLPLLLLAGSRAFISIIFYIAPSSGVVVTLDVFSTMFLAWAMVNSAVPLSRRWQRFASAGGGGGVVLALLPLFPGWPIPFQIHNIIIIVCAAPLVLASLGQVSWLHLAVLLALALANLFNLLHLEQVWFVLTLLAYGLFLAALHREGLQQIRQKQQATEVLARQAVSLSEERQRVVEVGEIIGAVPDASEAMAHLARTMAHVTHTDQAALLVLNIDNPDQFQVEVIFSPERPVELTSRFKQWLTLANFEVLQQAITEQRQLMFLPQYAVGPLSILYALWYEDRMGPTLVQPLTVYGQPVGLLVLGNPATQRPIREANQLLCQSLAAQIGSMVEAHRQYCALAEASKAQLAAVMETQATTQLSAPVMAGGDDGTRLSRPARLLKQPPQDNGDINMVDERLSILEAVHEGVVVSDASGRVQLVNRAAERILGKARLDLLGQPISTVYGQINSSDSIEDLASAFSRRNEPLPTFTQHKDRVVQGQLIPWRNEAREWMGIIAVFSDITHEIKADQARSDFVTALSRELRAPLTTIRGYSELIMRGDLEEYTPEQIHVQQIMHSSVDRMVAVLDNAVQMGVHTRKDYGPEFISLDVAEVINQVVYDISPLVTLHELTLETDINPNLPRLIADPKHIYRILENLLENGCQFTPPGGHVAVRAWVQQERVGNSLSAELILMVADNGIGIAKSEIGKIFDPYFQIPNAANRGGMGMGLAVVKKLVELNRGRVWVESVPGEGSLFQAAFPLTEE